MEYIAERVFPVQLFYCRILFNADEMQAGGVDELLSACLFLGSEKHLYLSLCHFGAVPGH